MCPNILKIPSGYPALPIKAQEIIIDFRLHVFVTFFSDVFRF